MFIPILFGTESGNSEYCADMLAQAITEEGFTSEAICMEDFEADSISDQNLVFIVTSTYGNGEPPDNAADFLDFLQNSTLELNQLSFAICSLGDTSFPMFAQCGKDFDEILEVRHAQRVIERVDCDADYDDDYEIFLDRILKHFGSSS